MKLECNDWLVRYDKIILSYLRSVGRSTIDGGEGTLAVGGARRHLLATQAYVGDKMVGYLPKAMGEGRGRPCLEHVC